VTHSSSKKSTLVFKVAKQCQYALLTIRSLGFRIPMLNSWGLHRGQFSSPRTYGYIKNHHCFFWTSDAVRVSGPYETMGLCRKAAVVSKAVGQVAMKSAKCIRHWPKKPCGIRKPWNLRKEALKWPKMKRTEAWMLLLKPSISTSFHHFPRRSKVLAHLHIALLWWSHCECAAGTGHQLTPFGWFWPFFFSRCQTGSILHNFIESSLKEESLCKDSHFHLGKTCLAMWKVAHGERKSCFI